MTHTAAAKGEDRRIEILKSATRRLGGPPAPRACLPRRLCTGLPRTARRPCGMVCFALDGGALLFPDRMSPAARPVAALAEGFRVLLSMGFGIGPRRPGGSARAKGPVCPAALPDYRALDTRPPLQFVT